MQNRNVGIVGCDPNGGRIRDLEVSGPACLVKYIETLVSPMPSVFPSFSTISMRERKR